VLDQNNYSVYRPGHEKLETTMAYLRLDMSHKRKVQKEINRRHSDAKPVYPLPEDSLTALSHMSLAAGHARGMDQLVMLFADTSSLTR